VVDDVKHFRDLILGVLLDPSLLGILVLMIWPWTNLVANLSPCRGGRVDFGFFGSCIARPMMTEGKISLIEITMKVSVMAEQVRHLYHLVTFLG